MRARMALHSQSLSVELREVRLRDKPPSMLALSPKGTVPVLHTDAGQVIDESLDIMCWALPATSAWFALLPLVQQRQWAEAFDANFKPLLDSYKYHRQDADWPLECYRDAGAECLQDFEQRLRTQPYLLGGQPQFLDLAVMPFVRQFAAVDRQWFDSQPQQRLRQWLDAWLVNPLFTGAMTKFPQWREGSSGETWPLAGGHANQ